jgi:hypothetical protein
MCLVYDPSDGRVLHRHEFLGEDPELYGPDATAARARIALEHAGHHHGATKLEVVHAPDGFRLEPGSVIRIEHGKPVARPAPRSASR